MTSLVTDYGTWDLPADWDGTNGLDFRLVDTVNGVEVIRFYAPAYALLLQTQAAVAAVGGLGVAMAYAAETGSTADAAPGDGLLTWNNATQASATTIYLDAEDANGIDITALIDTLDDSTSTIKGTLRLTQQSDNTKWILYNLTAVTSASGYRKLTVAAVDQSAASPFADGAALTLSFSRTGDKGDTGALNLTMGTLTGDVNAAGYDFTGIGALAAKYTTGLELNGNSGSIADFSTRPLSRITNSNDLSTSNLSTHWSLVNVTASKNVTSPLGDAWTISASGGGSVAHNIAAQRGPNSASPWGYVAAALVKAGTSSKVRVRVRTDSYAKGAYIDANLSTGASITAGALSTGTLLDSGVIPVGDSWYIVWVAGDVGSDGGVDLVADVYVLDSAGNDTYAQSGETLLFGGCAMYEGSTFRGFQNVGSSLAGSAELSGPVTTDAAGQSLRAQYADADASADTDLTVDGPQLVPLNLTGDHVVNVFGGGMDANGVYAANGWILEIVNDDGGSGGRDLTIQKGNELTYSADLQSTAEASETRPWTDTNTSITENAAVGPDGRTALQKLIADAGSAEHRRNYTISGLSPNQTISVSAIIRDPGDGLNIVFWLADAAATSNIIYVFVDPLSGSVVSGPTNAGNATGAAVTITALPNNSYRVDLTGHPNTSGSNCLLRVYLASGTSTTFDGAGNPGVYIGNVQVNPGQPKGMIEVGASRAIDNWRGATPSFTGQAAGTKGRIEIAPPAYDGYLEASFTERT